MNELKNKIREIIKEFLLEQTINESWYHGTYDSREIEQLGGFDKRTIVVDYISDPDQFKLIKTKLNKALDDKNYDLYDQYLNVVSELKDTYKYNKPIFLSNNYSVAKTYANSKRAFDYQNSTEKVFEVDVNCSNVVKISAYGERFAFINVDYVKRGFINAGVSEEEINRLISMFNYYYKDKSGIRTDAIGAIGSWLGFDCIDVMGVLDSYHGGSVKSTVRMVLDPSSVKIKL